MRFSIVLLCASAFIGGCGGASREQITVSVSPQSAVVGAGQTTKFTASVTGDNSGVVWSVNGTVGGTPDVGTVDSTGNYLAPAVASFFTTVVSAASKRDATKTASVSVTVVAPGVVTATGNIQVASYSISIPAQATVSVQFGLDTTYGLNTWQQSPPASGGVVSILVAGMKLNSTYHMRAVLRLGDGSEFDDSDHTFMTGDLPPASVPNLTGIATTGASPQSGVELLALTAGTNQTSVVVADLFGNTIWSYNPPGLHVGSGANPVKLLTNGHFLINFSTPVPDGGGSVLQEVDLGGQVIWEMTAAQLNQALAASTCAGCNVTVVGTHHDFVAMPNGHLIVIAALQRSESGLTGFPNPVTVTGDVLIDLDENHKPVWLWSSFDHLDLNRHPLLFPDWTHTNSIVYSPDDKALIISIRHQNWVLKIDYNDGQGTGDVLWKLGYQGDFVLQNGTDPVDWFYAQHDANVISANSSGNFQMLLYDDGNQRVLDTSGNICRVTPCESRVPIMQLDESAKTASIEWVDKLAPVFSFFGGSARVLQNGNIEFDECGLTVPGTSTLTNNSAIIEVTKTTPPQVVWQMQVTGQNAYRGFRIPSLYPGVQW
jgi:arylsulfate sulfotransferase